MAPCGLPINNKGKGRKFSVQEDITKPLAILANNFKRNKPNTEEKATPLTARSKNAILALLNSYKVLLNAYKENKEELQVSRFCENAMEHEVEGLRAEIQELHSTIQEDREAFQRLTELQLQEAPDTQEALLEQLIAKEAEIDRELFRLREDRVERRAHLWFDVMGKADESIEYPDQASRDRNLAMRREAYVNTKRTMAVETKEKLLLAREHIQQQILEISLDTQLDCHQPLPPSPISMDSDQISFVPDSHLGEDDNHVENNAAENGLQSREESWVTDNGEESSNVLGFPFDEDNNQPAADNHLEIIEENKSLKSEIQTTEEKIRKWESKFDRFRKGTKVTIDRLTSEVSSTHEAIREYRSAMEEFDEVRGRLIHDLAKVEAEKECLLIVAEDIALPILTRSAENIKRVKRNGAHVPLDNSHLPFNEALIRAGNIAATGGHVNAHFASIVLSEKGVVSRPVISHEMFLNMYGVSVDEYRHLYKASEVLDEMLVMHAMLVECGSFTEKTLSKTRDSLFKNQFAQCFLEFEAIDAPTPAEKGRIFDATVRANELTVFNEMIEIVQDIKRLQRDAA